MEETVKKQIEDFFETNKSLKFNEFVKKYNELFIDSKRIDKIYYLKKLYKKEQRLRISLLEKDFLEKQKENINNLNVIIEFLNVEAKILANDNKKTENRDSKIPKIKKRKIFKSEITFSQDTIDLVNKVEKGCDLNILNEQQIIQLIRYYHNKKESLLTKEGSFETIYYQVIKTNKYLEELIYLKNKKRELLEESSKKQISNNLKLPISFDQIGEIDDYFNINTINIIKSIDDIKKSDIKLKELYAIYDGCKKKEFEHKMLLISKRRQLKNYMNADEDNKLLKELNEAISRANIHMDILNNLLNYLKHYQKGMNNSNKNIEFQNEIEISLEQETIKKKMLDGKFVNDYDLEDILYSLGYIIKYEEINEQILEYVKDISNRCIYEEMDDEKQIDGIYYIWDAIKYRLLNTPKEDKNTRKNIKDMRILFDYVIKNYKEDKISIKHDYLFNVVDYFLKSEDDILYIKDLIEKLPKVVNVRHLNEEKESEHIVIYIVDRFIQNYRKMLKKDAYYVSKDYLKAVYLLFTRSYKLYLTQEEKKLIDKKLASFMNEVNKTLTSSGRKNAVKEDLKVMYTDKFYMHQKDNVLKEIDDHKLECSLNSVHMGLKNSLMQDRIDLTGECVVKLGDKYNAYSIEKRDNETILKIHVIDLYDIFVSYTTLDRYLFNQTLTGEDIDQIITNLIHMKQNEIYPTITYEISVDEKGNYKRKNGHVDKFNMYKSKIQIKRCYSNYDLIYSSGDVILKSYRDLYRNVIIKNHMNYNSNYILSDITDQIEKMLNQAIEEYFRFNKLPFIYSGIKQKNSQDFINHMNNIGHILSRLDNNDFNTIYSILENNKDEFHYSHLPFDGIYELSVKNPLSYPGIMIQRIIHELVLDNKNNNEEYDKVVKQYQNQIKETIMYLNYYNEYLDTDLLKENKGKIKKITRILF